MYTSILNKPDRIYFHACLCPVGYLNPRHRLPDVAIIVVINIFSLELLTHASSAIVLFTWFRTYQKIILLQDKHDRRNAF